MLTEILQRRGLSTALLEPPRRPNSLTLPFLSEAVDLFTRHCLRGSLFGVLFDVDVDGLCSGKLAVEYLKRLGARVKYTIGKGKSHGFTNDFLAWATSNKVDIVIVVDAGSNETHYHDLFNEHGIDVLVLDHHLIENPRMVYHTPKRVIVNSTHPESDNHDLSGAGTVYRFLERVNRDFNVPNLQSFEPYVGLSVLSDICSMTSIENRYYVRQLYMNRERELLFKPFRFYGSSRGFFLYDVIPAMNALIRLGKGDLAMEAFLTPQRKRLDQIIEESKACEAQQKVMIEELLANAKILSSNPNVVIARMPPSHNYPTLSGLFAGRLRDLYGRPALALYPTSDGDLRGSFRGEGHPYLDLFNRATVTAKGHQFAFGVYLPSETASTSLRALLEALPTPTGSYGIDLTWTEAETVKSAKLLEQIASFNETAGKNLPEIRVRIQLGTRNASPPISRRDRLKTLHFPLFTVHDFTDLPTSGLSSIDVIPTVSTEEPRLLRARSS